MTAPLHTLTFKEGVAYCRENGPETLIEALKERIRVLNPSLNTFIRFNPSGEPARRAEVTGPESRLGGAPLAVKDNICIQGRETGCASRILAGHVPPYSATVIRKLTEAGATILGQCNMDEFAFGSSCETSSAGPARNPWNPDCVPGGSSGGSAAAVAADMAIAALGSDTGGSIRQPASFCGVVGLKPTYGRVSRNGLIAFGSSFDQIGPLTKTVEDAALLLGILAGHDPLDSTCAQMPVPDYTTTLEGGVKGLRIGLPKEYFVKGLEPEVEKQVRHAADRLQACGAEVKEITLPHTEYSVAVYYIVAVAEASSNLGRFDGVRYGARVKASSLRDMYLETRDAGFGEEAKRRILLGTFVLSAGYYDAYYLKGQKVRTLIRRDFQTAFEQVDLILSPTSPTAAFRIGERVQDPIAMYLSDIFTIPANMAGIPAMSQPCGLTSEGLPVGVQLMAPHFREDLLFRAGHTLEQELGTASLKPELK